jgi:hypothetical protein
VQVHALWPQNGPFVGEQDGGAGFEEVEGLFGALVVEFFYVVRVVAADAYDLCEAVLVEICS